MAKRYYKACQENELAAGQTRIAEINNRRIILINHDGQIHALENLCSHDGGELGNGKILGSEIECPRHGGRFDIKTGQATRMPAIVEIESFETKTEGGHIYVAIP